MAEKAPAFQFYPADYLSDAKVQFLTSSQEGIYIRLLCYCWREGFIPSDPAQALMSCKRDAKLKDVEYVLRNLFVPSERPELLIHTRLEKERAKQAEFSKKASEAGKKSAARRQRPFNGRSTVVENELENNPTKTQPKSNSSSSSSSSDFPPNPRWGNLPAIDEFNEDRRRRNWFKPITREQRDDLASLRSWIGSHDPEVISRDHPTFSRILEAALSDMSELDFYRAVARFSAGELS